MMLSPPRLLPEQSCERPLPPLILFSEGFLQATLSIQNRVAFLSTCLGSASPSVSLPGGQGLPSPAQLPAWAAEDLPGEPSTCEQALTDPSVSHKPAAGTGGAWIFFWRRL